MSNPLARFEVLFFLPHLGSGGAEMNAVRLAPGLLAAGVTPVYAVARGPGSYAEFLPDGVEVIVLDSGKINSSTLRLIRAQLPLARLIDERRPEVVCPIMTKPGLAVLAALHRVQHRPSVVLSIQNSLSISHEQDPGLLEYLELRLIRRHFPRFDGAISLSEGVAQELRRLVPALHNRVEVVPNVGLPLPDQIEAALRVTRPPAGGECTVLACGRLTKQKDYPTLLRAFARLNGDGLRLQILGNGELKEELEQLAVELGIAEKVIFLGFQHDPFSYMRKADIFALSSRWEGFGNVLVEAMAMGVPVVATDCPHGPREIIEDGVTGLLVPPSQPDALVAALQRLVDNPELRLRMGQAGERRAQDFSSQRIGGEYARLFRKFSERSRSPTGAI